MSSTPSVLPAPISSVGPARIVAGRPASVQLHVTDATGAPSDVDPSTAVTFTIADGAGVTLTSGGTGTASHDGTGLYTAPIPAQAHPDRLTVTWAATMSGQPSQAVQLVKVIGQRLVDVPTLKADPALASYTATQLLPVMDQVEDAFDTVLGFPCVPTGERTEFWLGRSGTIESFPTVTGLPYGLGAPRVLVPQVSRAIYVVDALRWFQPIADLNLVKVGNSGALEYADGRPWPPGPYRLWLVHGMNPPPGDLRQAASTLIRYLARTDSNVPERAASVTSGGSTVVIALPTPDRPTGLPSVDVVLNRYRSGGAGGIAI